jgi:putative iron-dependent peroxidase
VSFLESVTDEDAAAATPAPASVAEPAPSTTAVSDGSLGIGSLKGEIRHE